MFFSPQENAESHGVSWECEGPWSFLAGGSLPFGDVLWYHKHCHSVRRESVLSALASRFLHYPIVDLHLQAQKNDWQEWYEHPGWTSRIARRRYVLIDSIVYRVWLIVLTKGSFPFLTHFPERTLDLWAKKYGDLYSVWLGNQLFVIISNPAIAKDLMVTNGAVFSGRKEMYLKSQTIFAGRGITATPYNDRWLGIVPDFF